MTVSRPVGGVLFRSPLPGSPSMAIHLCGPPGERTACGAGTDGPSPALDLAPGGGCRATRIAPRAGALLPHRFTLACTDTGVGHRRSALCCPDRQITPSWLSPAPCPWEPRPSSMRSCRTAAIRPTHRHRPVLQCARRRRNVPRMAGDRSSDPPPARARGSGFRQIPSFCAEGA